MTIFFSLLIIALGLMFLYDMWRDHKVMKELQTRTINEIWINAGSKPIKIYDRKNKND